MSHDAAQPVGFRFAAAGVQGLLATDLGEATPEILEPLADCDWLILESNHDEEMVLAGPYPWLLKQRLVGPRGHLSNQALGRCLRTHLGPRTRHLFLAHLSRTNNHPQLALEQVSAALSGASERGGSGPPDSLDSPEPALHSLGPMISRYSRPEMARIWSEENKFRKWLDVEVAVCQVLSDAGRIPPAAMSEIREKAGFSVERIHEIEAVTRHDVVAFIRAVSERVGPASRFIHMGLTSTDVVDNGPGAPGQGSLRVDRIRHRELSGGVAPQGPTATRTRR